MLNAANKKSEIFREVHELVSQIPRGKVATYGDIADIVLINPRYVGYILHHNPSPGRIPCHRIVDSRGKAAANFAFGGGDAQEYLPTSEGLIFTHHKLDLVRYRHTF